MKNNDSPLQVINTRMLRVRTGPDWQNPKGKTHKISIKDIIRYYKTQAGSMSGYRQLGTIGGDWREIDYIAQDVLAEFKEINIKGLRAEAKRQGIEPKF